MKTDFRKPFNHGLFDVCIIDSPWKFSVSLTKNQLKEHRYLNDSTLITINLEEFTEGLIFVWCVPSKHHICLKWLKKNNFSVVDEIVWVTMNSTSAKVAYSTRNLCMNGHKTVLVAEHLTFDRTRLTQVKPKNVIVREKQQGNTKPMDLHEISEMLLPGGKFIELFGCDQTLKNFWVSVRHSF